MGALYGLIGGLVIILLAYFTTKCYHHTNPSPLKTSPLKPSETNTHEEVHAYTLLDKDGEKYTILSTKSLDELKEELLNLKTNDCKN